MVATEEQRAVFRRVLREARNNSGLTQRDLARLLSISPGTVAQWETGDTAPRRDTAVHLEQALRLAEGSLLGLLGYLHPEAQARAVASVIEAVEADPDLTDDERELLATIYNQLVRRRKTQQAGQ